MAGTKEILATAIEFEKHGEGYYLRFLELVTDDGAKALMRGLASDEKEHAEILTKELESLGGKAKPPSKKEVEKGLRAIFPDDDVRGPLGSKGAAAALKMGIKTEERSIAFYSKNGANAPPQLRKIFEKLERMERAHLELLAENLRSLEDQNSWYGYVPILEG